MVKGTDHRPLSQKQKEQICHTFQLLMKFLAGCQGRVGAEESSAVRPVEIVDFFAQKLSKVLVFVVRRYLEGLFGSFRKHFFSIVPFPNLLVVLFIVLIGFRSFMFNTYLFRVYLPLNYMLDDFFNFIGLKIGAIFENQVIFIDP